MKNSVNTNLLIMDEVFDSSLDGFGTDEFLKIIRFVIKDANIFVISHKESLFDKFENVIKFEKVKGFSRIEGGSISALTQMKKVKKTIIHICKFN